MSLNTLLMSDEMIKERTAVHRNIDPKLIYPDIKVAQDMYILPILGTALYNKLQAAINANVWTGIEDYQTLLDNYIVDALMYHTLAELPTTLSYQFWNKGVVQKQGENTQLPSMSELIDISNKYRERGQWYSNRLRLYLGQNANEKFQEYLNPGNGMDTIMPEQKAYTMPVYLGDVDCGCSEIPNKPYSA